MTSGVGAFVDPDALVVAHLTGFHGTVPVVTDLPDPIPAGGVCQVISLGGPSAWDEARVRVDIDVRIPGRLGAAIPLAAAAHTRMGLLVGTTDAAGRRVHIVDCTTVFTRRFWAPDVDRMVGTYDLYLPVL